MRFANCVCLMMVCVLVYTSIFSQQTCDQGQGRQASKTCVSCSGSEELQQFQLAINGCRTSGSIVTTSQYALASEDVSGWLDHAH